MRVNKIKVTKEGRIQMEYEDFNSKGTTDEFTFLCCDEPKPSFHKALDDLGQDVIEMCELPAEYLSRIRISGLSLSHGGENKTMGAVIVAQMILHKSNVPLNLNTPHKTEDFYGETGDEAQLLSAGCQKRIRIMIEEAEDYIKGIRAQQNLFKMPIGKPAEEEKVTLSAVGKSVTLTLETKKRATKALRNLS